MAALQVRGVPHRNHRVVEEREVPAPIDAKRCTSHEDRVHRRGKAHDCQDASPSLTSLAGRSCISRYCEPFELTGTPSHEIDPRSPRCRTRRMHAMRPRPTNGENQRSGYFAASLQEPWGPRVSPPPRALHAWALATSIAPSREDVGAPRHAVLPAAGGAG
jgi:hypothetical protein